MVADPPIIQTLVGFMFVILKSSETRTHFNAYVTEFVAPFTEVTDPHNFEHPFYTPSPDLMQKQ